MALVTLYLPWCGPGQLAGDNLGVQLLQGVGSATDNAPVGGVSYVSVTCPGGALTTRRRLQGQQQQQQRGNGTAAAARALQGGAGGGILPSPAPYPQSLTFDAAGRATASGAVNAVIDLASPSFVVLRLPGIQNVWSTAHDVVANSPLAPPSFQRAKVLPSWYIPGPVDPSYPPGSADLLAAATAASMIAESLGAALGCPGASFQLSASSAKPMAPFASIFRVLTSAAAPPYVCVGGAVTVGIGQPSFFPLPPGPADAAAGAAAAALRAQQILGLSIGLGGGGGLLLLILLAFLAFWLLKRKEERARAEEEARAKAAAPSLDTLRTNPLHLEAESGRELKRKKPGAPAGSGSPRYIIPPWSLTGGGGGLGGSLSRGGPQQRAASPQQSSELVARSSSPRTQRSVSFTDYVNPFSQAQPQQAGQQLQLWKTLPPQQQSQQLVLQQSQQQQQQLQLESQLQLQQSLAQRQRAPSPPTHQRFYRPGIVDQQPFMPSAVSPLSPPQPPPPLAGPPTLRVPPTPS